MKKKIFGTMLVVAIAAGAMINVNLNQVSNKGDLALANVEALAQSLSKTENSIDWPSSSSSHCPSNFIPNAQNVYSAMATVANNPGVTGGNFHMTVAGTGGGVGATGSQGQSVFVTKTINCGPLTGACCNPGLNGVFTERVY
jgi:hypothetical protein